MFEKEAEDYATKHENTKYNTLEWWIKRNTFQEGAEFGYNKGLESGRSNWHDIRKNPEDLPPMYDLSASLSKNVLLDTGVIGYYNYNQKRWFASMGYRIIKAVIAWCEIPQFEE